MRISQDKIIRRYSIVRKVYFITLVSILLMLPLVGIGMLIFKDNGIIGKVVSVVGITYLIAVSFVLFIFRRCPNCLSLLSKYSFDPKVCPYCGVQLRK